VDSLKNKIIILIKEAGDKAASLFVFIKSKLFKKINGVDQNYHQTELDKKLIFSLSKSKIPRLKQIKYLGKFLTPKELWLIRISLVVLAVSFIFLSINYFKSHLQAVPVFGGEYVEGLVGAPSYINPLYSAASDADSDISYLIFSSLYKRDTKGNLIKDLAIEEQVSEDGKIYTFKIRDDARWHNGDNLTADDIVFTFKAIKDAKYKSPWRASFRGVEIEKTDESAIKFILEEPYAAFHELLIFGILPQKLWSQILPEAASLAELNIKPIGSGPYKFKSLVKDKSGNIKTYNLTANKEYYNQSPYIENLIFKFFVNSEEAIGALNEGLVDGLGYLPETLKKNIVAQDSLYFHALFLPQITAIFFNQKNNPESTGLNDLKVRQALAMAVNKPEIINNVFSGGVRPIDGPILPDSFAYNRDIKKYNFNLEEAEKLLNEAGWERFGLSRENIVQAEEDKQSEDEEVRKKAEPRLILGIGQWRKKSSSAKASADKEDKEEYMVINLTTVDSENNKKVVEKIKEDWEKIGAKTIINIVPSAQIQSEVIRPRNFQALFYGQVVGSDPDSYAFWHSSQVGAAGLNIADYVNKKADKLLEDARLTNDQPAREAKYKEFQDILAQDLPAIFMYSPTYTYLQGKKIKGFGTQNIILPHDRFADITGWYIQTGKRIIW